MMIMKSLGNLFNSPHVPSSSFASWDMNLRSTEILSQPIEAVFLGKADRIERWWICKVQDHSKRKSFRHKCKKQTYIEENTWKTLKNTSSSKSSKVKTSNFTPHFCLSTTPAFWGYTFTWSWSTLTDLQRWKPPLRQFCGGFLHLQISSWIGLNLKTNMFRVCVPSLVHFSIYCIRQCQFLTMFYRFSTLSSNLVEFVKSLGLTVFDLLTPSSESRAGIIVGRAVRSLSAPARGFLSFLSYGGSGHANGIFLNRLNGQSVVSKQERDENKRHDESREIPQKERISKWHHVLLSICS